MAFGFWAHALEEHAQVLKQLEEDTNLITGRMRARNIFFFLFLVGALLCSPGLFLALCSNNYK
jgi:hypothetical protein